MVPFNTIHAAFLQLKWYPNDPEKAAQIMGVPDTISAVLVPFVGTFCDRYGHRAHTILVTSSICAFVHFTFGTATSATLSSPVFLLVLLGLAYAFLLTFMPCVPLLIQEKWLGVAYGLTVSLSNLAWTIFPLIVAALINSDPSYFSTEMFFFLSSFLGVLASIALNVYDRKDNNNILNLPEMKYRKTNSDDFRFSQLPSNRRGYKNLSDLDDQVIWDAEEEVRSESDYGDVTLSGSFTNRRLTRRSESPRVTPSSSSLIN